MRRKKNVARVLAGILAVGMLASPVPPAVYAAENEIGTAAAQQETVVTEDAGAETGMEDAQAEAPGKETEADTGQENAGTESAGKG